MGEEKKASTISDRAAVALSTFGVGFLPLAPGTWGSLVGVLIYVAAVELTALYPDFPKPICFALTSVLMIALALAAFWSAKRTAIIKGDKDPQIVVIDEVLGQLVTFAFIPFTLSWQLILIGFLLFRVFDIWKPYPVRSLEDLPGGIGICADDIAAGVYAGVCLSIVYALFF